MEVQEFENKSLSREFGNIHDPNVFSLVSAEIKEHINKNKLMQNIKGKNYPLVEAWQFAGALIGLFPRLVSLTDVSKKDTEFKYRAEVEIVDSKTQNVIGKGIAICSNHESSKKYFDEYAIASMAQTRATGKAFRLCIGWLLKASGFESTPAEDIQQPTGEQQPTDSAMLREYRSFAMLAIEEVENSATIVRLGKMATIFKNDVEFLKKFRQMYTNCVNAGK